MKTLTFGLACTLTTLGFGLYPAHAQLFDHLRALADTRYPVGDPAVAVTNIHGQNVEGPKDIAVADLDGDGKADFAAANKDGSVTVYFGAGDGTFSLPKHLRTWANTPADQGGLSFTNYVTNSCTRVWTNSWVDHGTIKTNWTWVCVPGPTTVTTDVVLLSDGPTGLRGLALADFTGDGRRDIAVASPGEGVIYLLVNQGARNFASAIQIPAWLGVRDLAAGDFDGDGRADLAASGTTNGLAQYRSLGDGAFLVVTNLPSLGTDELDEDFPQPAFYLKTFRPPDSARDELVMGRAQGGEVRVLAANGTGQLEVQNTLSNVLVHALDAGPLLQPRSAGVPDLVSVNHEDDRLEIRAGLADARRFATNATVNLAVPGRAHGVAIADLDNDGWNDLIVVLQRFAKVRVLRNNQGTFEVASELTVGAGPRELGVGDFNGDGRMDAAVLNRVSQDVSVLIAHPTAFGFRSLDMIYPSDGEVVSLQVYDFNSDGRDDVVQLHRAAGELSVRLARADGTLSEPVFYGLGTMPSDTRTVDVNHDQILDILAVDLGGFVTVRLGRGDGTFGPEIRTSLQEYANGGWSGGSLFSLTTGDFDGDGNVDIAAGYMDCRVGLFKGNGDGTFVHRHTHLLGYETHGLATGDFDQDGDIDLVATPWDGSLIVVNNPGDLLSVTNLDRRFVTNSVLNGGAWTVVVTDYNHDGDLDLLVDGILGYTLYLGGPGLTFNWATNIIRPDASTPAISPVTADFNNDGFQDVIGACVGRNCVSISLGNASGFDEPFFISVPSSQLIATGDLDGDGLPDLVGTGEVLWTALSSRGPGPAVPPPPEVVRPLLAKPLINEVLAANDSVPLAADGGRMTDFVELFNGGGVPLPLLDWKLRLERTNSSGLRITNDYRFPSNAIIDAGNRLVLVCSDKLRTPFHTGFNLPAEGASLCLLRPDGSEADRVNYPAQEPDHAYARFQDGVNGFVVTDLPTPGTANADTGLMPPEVSLDGVDPASLQPDQPIRFFANARDDVGVVNLSVLWRRLDVPDDVTKRTILYDDGMHGDGGFQDGVFSGVLAEGLPYGGEIQFYLECLDLSGQTDTAPGNPRFVASGQTPAMYTLAIGITPPRLEISEVVANNVNGLRDEAGGTPDWVEIRNCSAEAVSLKGVTLGHNFFGDGERMTFADGVSLEPGQHLVIYADDKPEQGQLHAPFKLNVSGDQLFLTGVTASGARYLIDSLSYGPQTADTALARLGCGGPWVASTPTPSAGNVSGSWRGLVQPGSFLLAFPTRAGRNYTVQYTSNLGGAWTSLPSVRSVGLEQAVQMPLGVRRFFRVREE
jgi:hypothetical protein